MLALSGVDRGFERRSAQTKEYIICVYYFSLSMHNKELEQRLVRSKSE